MTDGRANNRNQRDEQGWRIPRDGTLSRKIYDRLKQGIGPTAIARRLRIKVANVNILAHRFRNPDWAKEQRRRRADNG